MPRMRHRKTPRQRNRDRARLTGVTNSVDAFEWVAKKKDRINIVAEGDSWFAYPKEWLVFGPNSNIIDHICNFLSGSKKTNILCRASNGDTAREMLSGKQLENLKELLKKRGELIDLFLFSGGGNDLVGKYDLLPVLNDYRKGYSAEQCIKEKIFKSKMKNITSAYNTLLKLRDQFAPQMTIICHTYDLLKPSPQGAEFLWGIEVTDSWIFPYLKEKGIPGNLHTPVVSILLKTFKEKLKEIAQTKENFMVVDTQGTLRIGHKNDWINEIHPTSSGFRKIATKIYKTMRVIHREIPRIA